MCVQKTGPVDVYEVTAEAMTPQTIKQGKNQGHPYQLKKK